MSFVCLFIVSFLSQGRSLRTQRAVLVTNCHFSRVAHSFGKGSARVAESQHHVAATLCKRYGVFCDIVLYRYKHKKGVNFRSLHLIF